MTRQVDAADFDSVRPLAPQEFDQIRQLAYRTFGLDLKTGTEELVSARLRKLVHGGGFRSFQEYYRSVVEDRTGQSLVALVDALATNHTSFLREPDHFQFLREQVIPGLSTRNPIELWSAACSTGEEVWTLAMVLEQVQPQRRVHITASDISTKALRFAQRGVYTAERCHGLSPGWLSRYFKAEGRPPVSYQIAPALRVQASFHGINLVESYSWPRSFPIIFCRNVMIYFDQPAQERVIAGLSHYLEPGGYLFVGHAEILTRVEHSLEYVRPAIYRKKGRKEGGWNK